MLGIDDLLAEMILKERPRPFGYVVLGASFMVALFIWLLSSAIFGVGPDVHITDVLLVAFGGPADGAVYDATFVRAVSELNQSLIVLVAIPVAVLASYGRRRHFRELVKLRSYVAEVARSERERMNAHT